MATSTAETALAVTLLAAFATEVEARADSLYEQPSFPFCSETLPNVAPGSKSFLPWMRGGSTGPTFPTACALEFVTASTDIIGGSHNARIMLARRNA
jgi:hypothetical protein